MSRFTPLHPGDRPLRHVAAGVGAGLLVLLVGLWHVQVMSRHRYQQRQESQSYRTVRLPAMRGKILDREGREFAGNSPRYRLDLYLDELRPQFQEEYKRRRAELMALKGRTGRPESDSLLTWFLSRFRRQKSGGGITRSELDQLNRESRYFVVSNTVADISRRLGTPLTLSEPALHQHFINKTALPLPLIPACTPAQIALISEQGWSIPGVELELVPVRSYPMAPSRPTWSGTSSATTRMWTTRRRMGGSITGSGIFGAPWDSKPPMTMNCGARQAPEVFW